MAQRARPRRSRGMVRQRPPPGDEPGLGPQAPGSRRAAPAGRGLAGPGADLHLSVDGLLLGRGPGRPGPPQPRLAALAPVPPHPPPPGAAQHLGGRLLRPRPGQAQGPGRRRRPGRYRALRPGRRLVRLPPRRHLGTGRLAGLSGGLAERSGAARGARPRPGHGVRPVVRAGDGQRRLRRGSRPPGVDPVRRRRRSARAPPPAGPGPVRSRSLGLLVRCHLHPRGAPGHRLSQVGPQLPSAGHGA